MIKKEAPETHENAGFVVKNSREAKQKKESKVRIEEASSDERNRMRENASPGASLWLAAMPLKCLFQTLTKGEWQDGVRLRYGIKIGHLRENCVCGEPYTEERGDDCKARGYVIHRHNAVSDHFYSLAQ